jgi:PAS domain S-box-containing protein
MPAKSSGESRKGIERRNSTILEIIPDIVYRLDKDGNFTYINECIKNLGYEPDELVGKHFSTVVHPDDIPRVSRSVVVEKMKGQVTGDDAAPKLFDERRSGKRMTKWLEVRLIPKDWGPELNGTRCIIGSLISVGEVLASGIYSAGKKEKKTFLGTVGIIRDITQKKKAEEERKKLEQQYLQAQRLEAIGLLAGGLAHDFKNFLTIALGYIEVVREQYKPQESAGIYLEKVQTALQRCKSLTQQLLSFSKAGVPQKRPFDFVRVLKNSVNLAIGESNIQTCFSIDPDLWPLEADEGQMVQVVDNIVINARHAMPSGGAIEVAVKNRLIKPGEHSVLGYGAYIEVAMTDHGIGISPEHLPKIFDPFFTTKQDGSGLGLSTSYFIVKNHHGHIEARSELGIGTTITIFLPAEVHANSNGPGPKKQNHRTGK